MRDSAARAAILLDFDGTLSPIVERPELARMAPGIRPALSDLARAFSVVAVVSGRSSEQVRDLVGVDGVRVEGLYGMQAGDDLAPVPDPLIRRVAAVGEGLPGSVVERKGPTVALHLRGTDDPEAAQEAAAVLLAPIARSWAMRLLRGKRVLELVPRDAPLKGDAVGRLLASVDVDAALYAGDDEADLDAFAALDRAVPAGVKVAVQGPETPGALVRAADLVVDGPDGMRELLRALIP